MGSRLVGWVAGTWVGYTFLAWQTHLCHHEVHDEDVDVGAVSLGQQEEEEHPYLGGGGGGGGGAEKEGSIFFIGPSYFRAIDLPLD